MHHLERLRRLVVVHQGLVVSPEAGQRVTPRVQDVRRDAPDLPRERDALGVVLQRAVPIRKSLVRERPVAQQPERLVIRIVQILRRVEVLDRRLELLQVHEHLRPAFAPGSVLGLHADDPG